MKFTLTFDGELPSNGSPKPKWEIRKQFHPQLEELWRISPVLIGAKKRRYVPIEGMILFENHHSHESDNFTPAADKIEKYIDLFKPIERGGRTFCPLVRDTLALKCSLKIIFLRKEEPGRVYQGGDIDNRIKTLFDALAVPKPEQVIADETIDDPIYCLLEDDSLITGFEIETHRLLSRPNSSKHEVHLVVQVDVRVMQPRPYNQSFLGE